MKHENLVLSSKFYKVIDNVKRFKICRLKRLKKKGGVE